MEPTTTITKLLSTATGATKWALAATKKFLERVSLLDQKKQAQEIENLNNYVKAVAGLLAQLKKAGATDQELLPLAEELLVPAAQTIVDGMKLLYHDKAKMRTSKARIERPPVLPGAMDRATEDKRADPRI